VERVVAEALERELGDGLAARLAASSLIAALGVAEDTAATRMEQGGRAPSPEEVDALLDAAIAYTEAGIAALRER
jgi:hypothetical protein